MPMAPMAVGAAFAAVPHRGRLPGCSKEPSRRANSSRALPPIGGYRGVPRSAPGTSSRIFATPTGMPSIRSRSWPPTPRRSSRPPRRWTWSAAYFLGSTKAKEAGDIGQFGEGLKVSILCLLRDCGADIALASGDRAVRIGLGDKIARLQLRPMVYRFFQLDPSHPPGTQY